MDNSKVKISKIFGRRHLCQAYLIDFLCFVGHPLLTMWSQDVMMAFYNFFLVNNKFEDFSSTHDMIFN